MTLFERIENTLGKCRDEKVTIHLYGDWIELRLQGLHPILHVRLVNDCIFRRHIASRLRSHFEETRVPILVCGETLCVYYSGPDLYRVMEGKLEDNLCRVIKGGISRDEMFLASALLNLSRHYLPHLMQGLNLRGKESIEFARFMGFDTALFPQKDLEVAARYLLFRWMSLYLLYRSTPAFRNDPLLLPASDSAEEFLLEMWRKYYSHLENLSDMKPSIGSSSSADIKMLSTWSHLPAFTADVHWITGFAGESPGLHHITSIASLVEEQETDMLASISRFVPDGNVAIFTPAFGLAALQVYMDRRARGLEHTESISSLTVFTSPGAGEVFQSTVLNLSGEGVPYRPEVVGAQMPPMKWGEFAALLRRDMEGRPFSTVLMDWRGREDVASLIQMVDYLWDVADDRIILLLDRDERSMEASEFVFRTARVEVMLTHEGSNSMALVITGRGRPSMNYTKMVRLRAPLERDMAEVIENAENRLDSSMVRLNIPVKGARFYYYRDTAMWLVASLQDKFLRWGGPMLGLVPGYVWKAFSTHRWSLLKEMARIHPEPCGKSNIRPDIIIAPGRGGLRLLDELQEPCRGMVGLEVRDRGRIPLLRWFLPGRAAHILHRIFGIEDLPIPDLTRPEGDPDRFLSRGEREEEYPVDGMEKKRTPLSELVELLRDYLREAEEPLTILKERIFDEKLRNRIIRAYSRKYGQLQQEIGGNRLF